MRFHHSGSSMTCRLRAGALVAVLALASSAWAADEVKVRFSWKLKGEYAHLYLAQEKGLYASKDLAVRMGEGAGAPAALGALLQGQEDVVVMPAIFAASAIQKGMRKGGHIILGWADPKLKAHCEALSIALHEYEWDEDLMLLRGPAIVEGMLKVLIENTDITIHRARICLVGQGTIGSLVTHTLLALGARVHGRLRGRPHPCSRPRSRSPPGSPCQTSQSTATNAAILLQRTTA